MEHKKSVQEDSLTITHSSSSGHIYPSQASSHLHVGHPFSSNLKPYSHIAAHSNRSQFLAFSVMLLPTERTFAINCH